MAGLCEGGNEPSGSLKAIYSSGRRRTEYDVIKDMNDKGPTDFRTKKTHNMTLNEDLHNVTRDEETKAGSMTEYESKGALAETSQTIGDNCGVKARDV
ncbi:hypothetical protein ANN_14888 [Periplaneta americana]|uniref:Uncharacterized protein n=1 Tax=Periplaneta americana TaxID=6978 RepID=A0ABQ8SYN7_PERAM|nr:hypothetical protein ANN_14888 [Periplaneta americana]